ncbi:MAG: diacylglycerol/lipid kinase family protein [Chloroflexota bacterium]
MPSRAAVFLNEGAGSARSDHVRRMVGLARRALDADLHVVATRDIGELTTWLTERIDGYETAVIAGGDGSLGVAYNVAADRKGLTLGYLPAGFGNATRHLLRLPATPDELVEVLVRRDVRPVDLIGVDGRLALFAGAGWDALVAGRYADAGARRLPGWASAVARSLPDLWRRPPVAVRADDWTVHRGPMELLVISTTPFYGRGLRINPGARPDAGRMALRIYPGPAPRFAVEAARWAFRIMPDAERIDARRVELRTLDDSGVAVQADGDVIGARPSWTFEIRPAAVRLIGRWS